MIPKVIFQVISSQACHGMDVTGIHMYEYKSELIKYSVVNADFEG